MLEALGRPDIPIYPGSKKPYSRPAVYAPDIHGKAILYQLLASDPGTNIEHIDSLGNTGLDGTDLLPKATVPPVTDKNAILAIRDAILAEPKGTPWLVATGTLTNVGLLFATFPEVAEHIQGLSIMGGAVGNGFTDAPMSRLPGEEARIGNTTPWAEFNTYVRTPNFLLSNPTFLEHIEII